MDFEKVVDEQAVHLYKYVTYIKEMKASCVRKWSTNANSDTRTG